MCNPSSPRIARVRSDIWPEVSSSSRRRVGKGHLTILLTMKYVIDSTRRKFRRNSSEAFLECTKDLIFDEPFGLRKLRIRV